MIRSFKLITAFAMAASAITAMACGEDAPPLDSTQPTAIPTRAGADPGDLSLGSVRDTTGLQAVVSSGVSITILRLAVADYSEFYDDQDAAGQRSLDSFSETAAAVTVGQIEITVENHNDQRVNLYPDKGTVIVGNESVVVSLFRSEAIGGEYLPGTLKHGRVFFFLRHTPVSQIESVTYAVDGASSETLSSFGFSFRVHVATR